MRKALDWVRTAKGWESQWRRAADPTGAAHPSVSRDQGSRCPRTAWYLCLGSSWRHGRGPSDRKSSKTTEWVGQWRHQNVQPQSPEPTNTCIPAGSDGDGELLPPCPCPKEAKAYLLCIIVSNVPSAVLSRINWGFFSVFSLKWLGRNFPDLSPCSKFSKCSPQSPLQNRPDLIIQWCTTLFYAL